MASKSSSGAVEHLRLDVDEDGERGEQPLLDRTAEGRGAAELVELGQPARRAGRREQQVGALERAFGAAGEGLVGDHPSGVELHDGLEDAAHAAGSQRCLERALRVLREEVHAPPSAAGPVRMSRTGGSPPMGGDVRPAG
jgi:hypothetical protein